MTKKLDPNEKGFLAGRKTHDPLADELAAEFVESITSGGADRGVELRDDFCEEEIGGPFVTTTAGVEFAEGADASNPVRARREPFPKT
jgi:hypothetical protein